MSGLLLIGVFILWTFTSFVVSIWTVKPLRLRWLKWLVGIVLFTALLLAPLGDELVGKHQFKSLCEKNARRESDFASIAGKAVVYDLKEFERVKGTLLETTSAQVNLLDQDSRNPLVTYYEYRVKGGWLIHALGISEGDAPLTFNNTCGPFGDDSAQSWADRYQIKTIFER